MQLFQALIFSIVQALTEFWPISSSGHLVLLHQFVSFEILDNLAFDTALHLGTALALIVYFRQDISRYWKAFWSMRKGVNFTHDDQRTVVNIILGTIPAVIVGLLAENWIEKYFRNLWTVAIALFVGGVVILIVERYSKRRIIYESLSIPEACLIGLAQALALIPGVSRSGATIVAGMAINLKREEAARFSFLLSIPVVLLAGVKQLFEVNLMLLNNREMFILLFSIVLTFWLGYLVIKGFLKFLQKNSLSVFAWYRIVLALIIVGVIYLIK